MIETYVYKKLVRLKLFSNIISRQHIINRKQCFFALLSKNLVVQEFLCERYGRNNPYTMNKNIYKDRSKKGCLYCLNSRI